MPPNDWRGSVLGIRGRLYLQVKDGAGRWRQRTLKLDDTPANRVIAERRLAEMRVLLKAREEVGPGVPTVRSWGTKWLDDRKTAVRDADHDSTRLRLHVFPVLGSMPLDEVRPRHLVDLVTRLRAEGKAPRTVRNVYSVVKAMFRDARIADVLTAADPCILTHRQIGKVRDAPTFKRAGAVFTADELAALVFDPRIPEDRRAWYALLGIGMLRTGEAAGLRWDSVQRAEPLGRLVVETSYDTGMTKTGVVRWMPVHPTLAAILAAWRLGGWARTFGRAPTGADLVVPVPQATNRGPRKLLGSMRDRHWARKRLVADFALLGMRHRRAHDLRRTGISLAQDGGARPDRLRWVTHAPPGETIDAYTSLAWGTLCDSVSRLTLPAIQRASTDVDPS